MKNEQKTKHGNENEYDNKNENNVNKILLLDSAGKNLKDTPVLEKALKKALKLYNAKLLSLNRVQTTGTSSCGIFLCVAFWLTCRSLLPSDIIKYFYTEKNTKKPRDFYKNDALAAYFGWNIFPCLRKKYTPLGLIFDSTFLETRRLKKKKKKKTKLKK